MLDAWYNLVDFAASFSGRPDFSVVVTTIKALFIASSAIFIGVSIWLRIKSGYFSDLKTKYSYYRKDKKKPAETPAITPAYAQELANYWQAVAGKLNSRDEAHWKLAVIESDNFFDYILSLLGYAGESMAEKLQQLNSDQLKNINDIWRVHKIRNALVHDPTFRLSFGQAEEVINTYERALRELKIIQ